MGLLLFYLYYEYCLHLYLYIISLFGNTGESCFDSDYDLNYLILCSI